MKLTQAVVLALSVPAGKMDHFVWDSELPGFGVRLRPGKSVWILQYRHGVQQRRLTLGDIRVVDAVKARKAAKDRLAAVQLGADPQQEKMEARARAGITLGAKVEVYLVDRGGKLRPNSVRAITRYLRNYWRPLHGIPLHRITRADVAARVSEMKVENGVASAVQARIALSSFFAWAIGEGFCDSNPVLGSNRPGAVGKRTRVLADWELKAIWDALRDDDYSRIVKLGILTGQRLNEISGMMWGEIDLDGGIWDTVLTRSRFLIRLWESFKVPRNGSAATMCLGPASMGFPVTHRQSVRLMSVLRRLSVSRWLPGCFTTCAGPATLAWAN
jgi:hypothetical protein